MQLNEGTLITVQLNGRPTPPLSYLKLLPSEVKVHVKREMVKKGWESTVPMQESRELKYAETQCVSNKMISPCLETHSEPKDFACVCGKWEMLKELSLTMTARQYLRGRKAHIIRKNNANDGCHI